MSCKSCNDCRMLEAVESIAKDIHILVKLQLPFPAPVSVGTTTVLEEDMARMIYQQDFGPLPSAEGRNKDIAYGEFVVVEDGVAQPSQRVDYDLTTRQPLAPLEWSAEKNKIAKLLLRYVDDDGMSSEVIEHDFGLISDTIAPDAPESIGTTTVLREEE